MNAPLPVSLLDPHWHWARALVASMPRSLRLANDVAGEDGLAIVDGTQAWSRDVSRLLSGGCRTVLVIEPGDAEPDAILALADAAENSGAEVILSEGFAGNPAVADFAAWLDHGFPVFAVQGTGAATGQSMLFAQLRILRMLGVTATETEKRPVLVTPGAFLAELAARRAEVPITLRLAGGVCESVAPRQTLTAFAPDATARLDLHGGWEARPASASLVTDEGQRILPAIHESAHRHALRRLVATHGEPPSRQSAARLRILAGDIALARSMYSSR